MLWLFDDILDALSLTFSIRFVTARNWVAILMNMISSSQGR